MGSNYEKQVFGARDIFLRYDQQTLLERYDLEYDEKYLYIELLKKKYRIDRKTGEVQAECGRTLEDGNGAEWYETCLDFLVVMTIYAVLCYPQGKPALAGEWCQLASLQMTGSSPSQEPFLRASAGKFSGRVSELKAALEWLGGKEQAVPASADACFLLPLFSFFPVLFQFWDGDEEFAPSITILWDKNSLKFMHFETLYYVTNHLMERLEDLMGSK